MSKWLAENILFVSDSCYGLFIYVNFVSRIIPRYSLRIVFWKGEREGHKFKIEVSERQMWEV